MKEYKECQHGHQEEISREHDGDGFYIRYKCLLCGDEITEYYELVNRYNNTKGTELDIPEKAREGLKEMKHVPEVMEKVIELSVTEGDFEKVFDRKPKDQEEFEGFARYCEKGVHSQLDWDIIFDCIKDAMKRDQKCS